MACGTGTGTDRTWLSAKGSHRSQPLSKAANSQCTSIDWFFGHYLSSYLKIWDFQWFPILLALRCYFLTNRLFSGRAASQFLRFKSVDLRSRIALQSRGWPSSQSFRFSFHWVRARGGSCWRSTHRSSRYCCYPNRGTSDMGWSGQPKCLLSYFHYNRPIRGLLGVQSQKSSWSHYSKH